MQIYTRMNMNMKVTNCLLKQNLPICIDMLSTDIISESDMKINNLFQCVRCLHKIKVSTFTYEQENRMIQLWCLINNTRRFNFYFYCINNVLLLYFILLKIHSSTLGNYFSANRFTFAVFWVTLTNVSMGEFA